MLETFIRLFWRAKKGTGLFKKPNWDAVRPSKIPVDERPAWMTYDDAWVGEVRRALVACRVFLFLPVSTCSNTSRIIPTRTDLTMREGVPPGL